MSMTLEEVAAIPKEMLVATDVAPFLGYDPAYIRWAAEECPDKLPFPVIRINGRTRIPKRLFVAVFAGNTEVAV